MTTEAQQFGKMARVWADNARIQIRTIDDPARWIVDNRENLGRCIKFANDAHLTIVQAIAARNAELGIT